jgi:hypothetical protein
MGPGFFGSSWGLFWSVLRTLGFFAVCCLAGGLLGCVSTALAFPCIAIGLVRFAFGCLPTALAFPCFVIALLASPLCGAAPTFFAAAKKVGKENGLQPPALSEPSRSSTGNGPRRDLPSHHISVRDKALIRSSVALRAPPLGITPRSNADVTPTSSVSLANPSATHGVRSGADECFVTNVVNARARLVFGPLRINLSGGHL